MQPKGRLSTAKAGGQRCCSQQTKLSRLRSSGLRRLRNYWILPVGRDHANALRQNPNRPPTKSANHAPQPGHQGRSATTQPKQLVTPVMDDQLATAATAAAQETGTRSAACAARSGPQPGREQWQSCEPCRRTPARSRTPQQRQPDEQEHATHCQFHCRALPGLQKLGAGRRRLPQHTWLPSVGEHVCWRRKHSKQPSSFTIVLYNMSHSVVYQDGITTSHAGERMAAQAIHRKTTHPLVSRGPRLQLHTARSGSPTLTKVAIPPRGCPDGLHPNGKVANCQCKL